MSGMRKATTPNTTAKMRTQPTNHHRLFHALATRAMNSAFAEPPVATRCLVQSFTLQALRQARRSMLDVIAHASLCQQYGLCIPKDIQTAGPDDYGQQQCA